MVINKIKVGLALSIKRSPVYVGLFIVIRILLFYMMRVRRSRGQRSAGTVESTIGGEPQVVGWWGIRTLIL